MPAGGDQPLNQEESPVLRRPAPPGWEECRQNPSDISAAGHATNSWAGKAPTWWEFPRTSLGWKTKACPKDPPKVFKMSSCWDSNRKGGRGGTINVLEIFLHQHSHTASSLPRKPASHDHTPYTAVFLLLLKPRSKISLVLTSGFFKRLVSVSQALFTYLCTARTCSIHYSTLHHSCTAIHVTASCVVSVTHSYTYYVSLSLFFAADTFTLTHLAMDTNPTLFLKHMETLNTAESAMIFPLGKIT